MKYLALDFGSQRIGIAVAEDPPRLASAHGVLERKSLRQDIAEVTRLVSNYGAGCLVVGAPHTLQGTAGALQRELTHFAEQLELSLHEAGHAVQLVWWDERFSTSQARRLGREAGISDRQGRVATGARSVDARAAALILQSYLDSDGKAVALPDATPDPVPEVKDLF